MAYKFKPRSQSDYDTAANESSGAFDALFKEAPLFAAKEGDHRIRVCPPTWEGAKHYAYRFMVHYGVGPDNNKYVCARAMKDEPCAVCDEMEAAREDGDVEYEKSLRAGKRSLAWIIDRNNVKAGPQLYDMPLKKVDAEISNQSKDKETGDTLQLDDPDEGYDIYFTRKGKTKENTVYSGFQRASKPTPLSRDSKVQEEWMTFLEEHPLSEMLRFYSYDYIKKQHSGKARRRAAEEEEERPAKKRTADGGDEPIGRGVSEDEDERPAKSSKRREIDEPEDDRPARMKEEDDGETRRSSRTSSDRDGERDRPRGKSVRDEEDDDDRPAKKRKVVDDEDDMPKKRATVEDDEDDRPAKKRVVEDEEDEPKPSRRVKLEKDEDDERPAKKRVADEDDERPVKRRASVEDDDEPPVKKRRVVDEDEDDRPAKRRVEEDDDDRPTGRGQSASKRVSRGEDD